MIPGLISALTGVQKAPGSSSSSHRRRRSAPGDAPRSASREPTTSSSSPMSSASRPPKPVPGGRGHRHRSASWPAHGDLRRCHRPERDDAQDHPARRHRPAAAHRGQMAMSSRLAKRSRCTTTARCGRTAKVFDSSWQRKTPATFVIVIGKVVKGWDATLVGKKVGSRVLLRHSAQGRLRCERSAPGHLGDRHDGLRRRHPRRVLISVRPDVITRPVVTTHLSRGHHGWSVDRDKPEIDFPGTPRPPSWSSRTRHRRR